MILCIDVGNSQILIGVFDNDNLITKFRYNTSQGMSSDQFGIFLKMILSEKNVNYLYIEHIVICSVVSELDYSISSACIKYFSLKPCFITYTSKIGLNINYASASEIGADRISTAIAANYLYPEQNLIVVDMGTATTICAITKNNEYLAGAILPGLKLQVKSLTSNTAKLPSVEIIKPQDSIGKSTKENIQIGLFYGHLGAVKEIISHLTRHAFNNESYLIIGTGGFSGLYKSEKLFEIIIPDLVLIGLNQFAILKGFQELDLILK